MELFDKKFVYLEWDDVLEGKEVFIADTFPELRRRVENNNDSFMCTVERNDGDYPFAVTGANYAFVYYDPLYNVKLAWKQGKQIQGRAKLSSDSWVDCCCPTWSDKYEYRVKQEKKWMPFKDIQELKYAWENKWDHLAHPELVEPLIWVRSKSNTTSTYLITHYCENIGVVYLCGFLSVGLEQLFEDYTFLDRSPFGVIESVEEEVEE